MYPMFDADISRMNEVYELQPIAIDSFTAVNKRLEQFKEILDKEFTELVDIQVGADQPGNLDPSILVRTRVDLADLLGDIVVYCASEARRWNIPLGRVLRDAIMPSNFSKLGEDGKPIKNPVTDKFEKGPKYWKPEPLIQMILEQHDREQEQQLP